MSLDGAGWRAYDIDVSTGDPSSQGRVAKLVGKTSTVLELGCSTGRTSRLLNEQGCSVVGLDYDQGALQRAAEWCDEVHQVDFNEHSWVEALAGRTFEAVILADVLEHVLHPEDLLAQVIPLLAPEGILITSLPNIAHASVRVALFGGEFPYEDSGLLDRTHLHFYTRESGKALLEDAGYELVHEEAVEHPIEEGVPFTWQPPAELVEQVLAMPDSLTYQFVFVSRALARHTAAASAPRTPPDPDHALVQAQAKALRAAEDEASSLRQQLAYIQESRVWKLRTHIVKVMRR